MQVPPPLSHAALFPVLSRMHTLFRHACAVSHRPGCYGMAALPGPYPSPQGDARIIVLCNITQCVIIFSDLIGPSAPIGPFTRNTTSQSFGHGEKPSLHVQSQSPDASIFYHRCNASIFSFLHLTYMHCNPTLHRWKIPCRAKPRITPFNVTIPFSHPVKPRHDQKNHTLEIPVQHPIRL